MSLLSKIEYQFLSMLRAQIAWSHTDTFELGLLVVLLAFVLHLKYHTYNGLLLQIFLSSTTTLLIYNNFLYLFFYYSKLFYVVRKFST